MDWSRTPPGTCPQARWALCRSEPSPGSRRVAAATAGPAPPPNWCQNWLAGAAPPGARACSAVALGGPGQARASGLGGAPRTSRPAKPGGVLECTQEHAGPEWESSPGWVAGSGGQGQMVVRRKAPADLSGQKKTESLGRNVCRGQVPGTLQSLRGGHPLGPPKLSPSQMWHNGYENALAHQSAHPNRFLKDARSLRFWAAIL